MKYLLLLGLALVLYYVLRAPRVRADKAAPGAARQPALPQAMVRCPVCSVHLPQADALAGASGRQYCSHEHRVSGGN